jgi:rhamnulokinase
MSTTRCAAIDLGASNGRVVVVDCDGERLGLSEVRRFDTPRLRDPRTGYHCWDLHGIEREVLAGLAAAAAMTPLASVGVDGWGVDYVLVDDQRIPVAPAVSYRDDRTRGMMDAVFAQMPPEEIYRRTGIQFQPFNTLYQLAATARQQPSWLARARHLLMLPDYLHVRLGGAIANEYTNATTTQLCDLAGGDWDGDLLAAAGIARELVTRPVAPGTILGESTAPGGGPPFQVTAPATHDTASAVAGIPLAGFEEVFISSGSWSLMGVESPRPLADATARRLNFSNEGGVERRYRVLKNIAGLWLVQRIAQELAISDAALLVAAAEAAAPWRCLIDPDEPRFLNPPSMIAAIRGFCAETGQPEPSDPGALVRCALESLALCYRRVKAELERLLGHPVTRIHIGGGGGQNRLLDQLAADACQVPVIVGPAEISVLGNACVQLIALGVLGSLGEARAMIGRSFAALEVTPGPPVPDAVWARFEGFASRHPAAEVVDRRSAGPAPSGPVHRETTPS